MSAELQASRHDATLILTLSNPGAYNTLHADMCAAAIEVLSTAERDESVRVVVLTGASASFCAGSNLNQLLEYRAGDQSGQAAFLDNLHGWIEAIRGCPKPVIAAVEGEIIGAGFSLALACDMLIAGNSAKFAMPWVRTGLTPEGGAAWLLAQSLPRQVVSEILLDGKPIAADRLHALGLINKLVADGQALDAALAWADSLAEASPRAAERTKLLLSRAPDDAFDQHCEAEKQAFIESLYHRDAHEGIQAALQKRKPQFK